MNDRSRRLDQVYALWRSRPPERRKDYHAEQFSDELWASGLRLAKNQLTHYQHTMATIRGAMEDEGM